MARRLKHDGHRGGQRGGTRRRVPHVLRIYLPRFGPGLITGAADDDPSGIATYSQAGARFGMDILWTMPVLYPLVSAIQMTSARIGRVTGKGLAANMRELFPAPLVMVLVGLLLVANTINIGADLAAMGAAAELVTGGNRHLFALLFALASLALQVLVPYRRYVHFLKALTLVLFAYVGVLLAVRVDWGEAATRLVAPRLSFGSDLAIMLVAIAGTTISPYLLFWQASEEVEDERADPIDRPLLERPREGPRQLRRIREDTLAGMGFGNLIAMSIMLTTAVTLHASGATEIASSAEAAQALRPLAGDFAFALFSLGIVGTGLLAIPVLAGSAAFAVAEARGWPSGLECEAFQAKGFYAVIAFAILAGLAVDYSPLDPIRALVWAAVVNGVVAVPLMAAMMIIVSRRDEMGRFVAGPVLRLLGWLATAAMAAAAVTMFATL